ncbi:MAG: NAD-binding protein [Anaerolineales bacterium]|nr:NAD-binding protein [Anaerolineales bacterium]
MRQFRIPITIYIVAIFGGGILYKLIAQTVNEPVLNIWEAIYLVLTLTFLQSNGVFPTSPWLEIFYFVMPVIGISILALGLADFGYLLFNRRERTKEWEMAIAKTYKNHTIMVGLGHLGFRVVQKLHDLGEKVVVIEIKPKADLNADVQKMGIPIIHDDGSRQATLEAAGITCAKTIVSCTQNDALNLQIAVKARNLNPDIRVVVRIFDDDFAQSLQEQFGFTALSATGMSAPAFAAAAAGADITRPITVEGQSFCLARLNVSHNSKLVGRTVEHVEQKYDVSVVLLRDKQESDLHPAGNRIIFEQNALAIIGSPEKINLVVHDS